MYQIILLDEANMRLRDRQYLIVDHQFPYFSNKEEAFTALKEWADSYGELFPLIRRVGDISAHIVDLGNTTKIAISRGGIGNVSITFNGVEVDDHIEPVDFMAKIFNSK